MPSLDISTPKFPGCILVFDEADQELAAQFKWRPAVRKNTTYAVWSAPRTLGWREIVYLHQQLMPCGPGLVIDHVNRNGLDNRRANLRAVPVGANTRNQTKRLSRSRYRGVLIYETTTGAVRFKAYASLNGRQVHIGVFDTETEAACARDRYVVEHFPGISPLNFPEAEHGN